MLTQYLPGDIHQEEHVDRERDGWRVRGARGLKGGRGEASGSQARGSCAGRADRQRRVEVNSCYLRGR